MLFLICSAVPRTRIIYQHALMLYPDGLFKIEIVVLETPHDDRRMVHGRFDIIPHLEVSGSRYYIDTVLVAQIEELIGERETVRDDAIYAGSLHEDDVLTHAVLGNGNAALGIEFIVFDEREIDLSLP